MGLVSLKRVRLRLGIVYREVVVVARRSTKDETDLKPQNSGIQNRYMAETDTENHEQTKRQQTLILI